MPMFFLSGAMYPVKFLPKVLRMLATLNPLTYGIDAMKHVIFPLEAGPMGPDYSIITSASVIILTSIAFVVIAGRAFEKKR